MVSNIPDGPRAQTRMSAQATAVLVEREVGHSKQCCNIAVATGTFWE
jgi:hypothetical protein